MIGQRGGEHLQLRPFRLVPLLHPVEDGRRISGGGVDRVTVVRDAHDGAVVLDHAVGATHDAVTNLADRKCAHHVRVEHVEEGGGVTSRDIDDTERRTVEDADSRTDSGTFTEHSRCHVFAAAWIEAWTLPLADVLEHRPAITVPLVQRGSSNRVVAIASVATCQGGERHRGVRRTERRGSGVGDVDAEQLRDDARSDDARRLALIVCRTDRGVALDMLHRRHPGADGTLDVGDRGISLEIDKRCRSVGFGNSPTHFCRGRGAFTDVRNGSELGCHDAERAHC